MRVCLGLKFDAPKARSRLDPDCSTGQECAAREPGYALTAGKGAGGAFDGQIGSTKRGDRHAKCRSKRDSPLANNDATNSR